MRVDAAQAAKAQRLRALHDRRAPLLIGNAWDAASARAFELAGFDAIGTSSAGVAWAHGYPDDDSLPLQAMLDAIERIAASVFLPVTADLGRGYGDTPQDVARACEAAVAAGAVGANLEDSAAAGAPDALVDVDSQVARIRAVRQAADALGIAFVINARTDSWWKRLGDEESRIAESIRRGRRYRDAGADCVFVPGVTRSDSIRRLVEGIGGPINVLTVPGCPPIDELRRLGVARVSVGSGAARAALSLTMRIARELRSSGTYETLQTDTLGYADVDGWFGRR